METQGRYALLTKYVGISRLIYILKVVRSGIQITSSIYYDSIDIPSCASNIPESADSVPTNIKTYWYCQDCKKTFSFIKAQAIQHMHDGCTSNSPAH